MADNSIRIAVRCRPFTEDEALKIQTRDEDTPFFGDGNLAGTPKKQSSLAGNHGRGWRQVVDVLDHRTLVFDKAETGPVREFAQATAFRCAPGSRPLYKDQRFLFDSVYGPNSTQDQVFDGTVKDLLPGLLDGFNATVFAYGATGCGKTHTISGTTEQPGIIVKTMEELFRLIESKKDDLNVSISLSYLEIYNEIIRDLLIEEGTVTTKGGLAMREDEARKISVVALSERTPKSTSEVLELILVGNSRRAQSPTHANATSSRSHAVLQINVKCSKVISEVDLENGGMSTDHTMATLSIIDLAGSERASATKNMGDRMKEGSAINKSLLALGNCINALCRPQDKKVHVPYRDSKLTRLLKFSLGGNCKTAMIVCVSPSSAHYEDTLNTLQYANRAKKISTKVSSNSYNVGNHITQYLTKISALQAANADLKARLDQKGSVDVSLERRRKQEMKAEIDRATTDLRSKIDTTKVSIMNGVACQVLLFAAEARIRPVRLRLLEIEELSQRQQLPADIISERDCLKSFIAADEASLRHDSELQNRSRSCVTPAAGLEGVLRAVSERRMEKLDEIGSDFIKVLVKSSKAEVELVKADTREKELKTVVENQARMVAQLFSILGRSTTMIKEGQEALESSSTDPEAVLSVATSLKQLSLTSDQAFSALIGCSSGAPVAGQPSALSSFNSSSFSLPSVRHYAPPVVSHKQKPRRSSLSLGGPKSFAQQSALSASPRRILVAKPARLLSSSPVKGNTPKKTNSNLLINNVKQKSLRWRDEAGEGDIDDGARTSSSEAFSPGETDTDADWIDDKADSDVSPQPIYRMPTLPKSRVSIGGGGGRMNPNFLKSTKANALSSMAEEGESPVSKRPLSESTSINNTTYAPFTSSSLKLPPLSVHKPRSSIAGNTSRSLMFGNTSMSAGDVSYLSQPPSRPLSSLPSSSTTKARSVVGIPPRAVMSPGKRRTSIGPVRSERKKGRTSLIPTSSHNSPPGSQHNGRSSGANESPSSVVSPTSAAVAAAASKSILGGGARRVLMETANGTRSPNKRPSSGRMSSMNGGVGSANATVIKSRPSMSTISGSLPSYMAPTVSREVQMAASGTASSTGYLGLAETLRGSKAPGGTWR